MAKAIPMLKLNNGVEMPALGFGTFADELVEGESKVAVIAALDVGYRHLDCAWYYANEKEIGSALKEWLSRNPTVTRKDIFITTKVWPHLMEPEDVEWSLNNSLESLGIDYVDAFLIHWPFVAEKTVDHQVKRGPDGKYIIKPTLTANLQPTWRAMEKLHLAGKAHSIGVSNFTPAHLTQLLNYATIPPSINQVEIHPYFPNTALIEWCFAHNILPVAYSPLGSQGQVKSDRPGLIADQELNALARKKGVSLAQLLIAWGLKRGYAVLPKSSNAGRIKSNFEVVELSGEEFAAVNKVGEGRKTRFVNPKGMFGYKVWPEEEDT